MLKRNISSSVRFPGGPVRDGSSSAGASRIKRNGVHDFANQCQCFTLPTLERPHRTRRPDSVSIALVVLIQLSLYIFVF